MEDDHSNQDVDQIMDNSNKKKLSQYFDCGTGEAIRGFLLGRPLTLINHADKDTQDGDEDNEEKNLYRNKQKQQQYQIQEPKVTKDEEELDEPMAFSDLSNPKRNVWIVTTAALPWRTGTAINPFLRALYFVRRRLFLYKSFDYHVTDTADAADDDDNDNDARSPGTSHDNNNHHHNRVGKITLVIPWLVDIKHAQKLYGKDIVTKYGPEGKQQQLQWMQKYATEQCGMGEEMTYLHVLFYDATYWPAFGSIFPTVDICSLIPTKEADVAILEEPEHLNWLRVPAGLQDDKEEGGGGGGGGGDEGKIDKDSPGLILDTDSFCLGGSKVDAHDGIDKEEEDQEKVRLQEKSHSHEDTLNSEPLEEKEENKEEEEEEKEEEETRQSTQAMNELGWAHKFEFVVGVIHTNYTAYMKQYGLGSTIVAAPVINAMSSMVIRAYCHRVIRLSGVIPSYAHWKEVTCNVHGVREDFLGGSSSSSSSSSGGGGMGCRDGCVDDDDVRNKECPQDRAPIYFIGKLLWAKGFDKMLKVQESYRNSHPSKEYFSIDIFGGGPDEIEIKRAFHGRLSAPSRLVSAISSDEGGGDDGGVDEDGDDEEEDGDAARVENGASGNHHNYDQDVSKDVLTSSTSIRGELMRLVKNNDETIPEVYANAKNYINAGFEVVVTDNDHDNTTTNTTCGDAIVMECRTLVQDESGVVVAPANMKIISPNSKTNPISILSDVSEKSISTGISTTKAVKSLADSALKTGLAITFTQDESDQMVEDGDIQIQQPPSYRFDPPKTIYELRRTPIPARFMGVLDHAALLNMPYKIFLNPSVTEVLCTTTAEALAMGKFVIIPKHISNEFFFQFSNCLCYESIEECVEKIQWALENEPSPLTEEEAHIFTWDAATDRMIQASIITKREARYRSEKGHDKADSRMAKIHSEGGKKSDLIRRAFFGQTNAEDRGKVDKVSTV
eukprot:CAMPEP_0176491984 /NCGR_PEP_ID=MMETSP0200_2-20121128/8728_1 /TAXON_ID=947934 /ORGANISM="Chaetoceros sp., Strain GSL56" /LENGTH=951 /DNA_ID=CAMNT_0017889459 /DNA_START=96 /DNA_END=2951 /DNA_ORIENTATION=+